MGSTHEAIHKLTNTAPQKRRKSKADTSKQRKGYNLTIEGHMEQAYPLVNHVIFLKQLSRRIQDKRFHNLMKDLLHAGYLDEFKVSHHPVTGVPQDSGVSSMIWNIYVYHFDVYIMTEIQTLVRACRREFLRDPEKWKCLHRDEDKKKSREYRKFADYENDLNKKTMSELRYTMRTAPPEQSSESGPRFPWSESPQGSQVMDLGRSQ